MLQSRWALQLAYFTTSLSVGLSTNLTTGLNYSLPSIAHVSWVLTGDERSPLPSDSDQLASLKDIRTALEGQYKNKEDAKPAELAAELYEMATSLEGAQVDKLMLLKETVRLASKSQKLELALIAAKCVTRDWQIDELEYRTNVLLDYAQPFLEKQRPFYETAKYSILFDTATILVAELVYRDRCGEALKSPDGAYKLAQNYGKIMDNTVGVNREARRRLKILVEYTEALRVYEQAEVDLKKDRKSLAAKEIIGRDICFRQYDFERGIPYLIDSSDEKLALCARLDDLKPDKYEDQVQMAEHWREWSSTQSGPSQVGAMRRSWYWYQSAFQSTAGIERAKLNKPILKLQSEIDVLVGDAPLEIVAETCLEIAHFPDSSEFNELCVASKIDRKKNNQSAHQRPRAEPTNWAIGLRVDDGVHWLVEHQAEDGSWSPSGFNEQCGDGDSVDACSGAGTEQNIIGVTGLALLALMAQSNSPKCGDVDAAIDAGIQWILASQNIESGSFDGGQNRSESSKEARYGHAIATLVLCQEYQWNPSENLGLAIKRATDYIWQTRDTKSVWGYRSEDNNAKFVAFDTHLASWMILALDAAKNSKITIEPTIYKDITGLLTERTDRSSGRVGYGNMGSISMTESSSGLSTEALTAAALIMQKKWNSKDLAQVQSQLKLLEDCAPELQGLFDEELLSANTSGVDIFYFLQGAQATYLWRNMSPIAWHKWESSISELLTVNQNVMKGHAYGSWDPNGPLELSGGRVYSTALGILALSTSWRTSTNL